MSIQYFDGHKSVKLNDLPAEAWTVLSGGRGAVGVDRLYSTISWLYRCVDIRAGAVAGMPFELKRRGAVIYDSTEDEQPPAGLEWLADLPELLQKTEAAAVLGGRAYWERRGNVLGTRLLGFDWLLPWTMTPEYAGDALSYFTRRVPVLAPGSVPREIPLQPDQVVYFWPPDYAVELGPAANYPGRAVMQNAGVIGSMDEFLKGYFDRGMVKATLLKYQDHISPAEAQRVKEWWRRVFTGVKNAFSTEVVRGDFTAETIGEGIRDLRDNALLDKERDGIAVGMGVPPSKLLPEGVNRATRDADETAFIMDTVLPEARWIFKAINRQVLNPAGLHLTAAPQKLAVMQEDENQRSQALSNYVGAGMSLATAVAVLGIHIPEGMALATAAPPPPPVSNPAADVMVEEEARRFMRWLKKRGDAADPAAFESQHLTAEDKAALARST